MRALITLVRWDAILQARNGFYWATAFVVVVMGALGGLLYILRQHLKGYKVKPVEYLARPLFGAVSAAILTVMLNLPNHFNSLFVGYFGIDAWDAVMSRVEGKIGSFFKHEPKQPPKPPSP